jgi:DNA repair photolyase
MKITQKEAKSILTPSKLPGADYVVNPYSGCAFGCVYCYADFTRRFTGHVDDKWGEYVDIKINTPEIFEKELSRLSKKIVKKNEFKEGGKPVIFFGSVTDPYQGVEAKYKLTRKCLEIVVNNDIKKDLKISLLTKSPLVTRDIDIFKQIPNLEVGMTITSTEDEVSRMFESSAPSSSLRIKALEKLNEEGIDTYAFVGPLLPHFVANEESLDKLFRSIKKSNTNRVWVEHINLKGKKMQRLMELVGDKLSKEEYKLFVDSQSEEYKNRLSEVVLKLIEKYELELVGNRVVDHIKLDKQ